MTNQSMCNEMDLMQRMRKQTGGNFLTEKEVNALCADLMMLSKIFKGVFGLNIILSDKAPKPVFTIDEEFIQAGLEHELIKSGHLTPKETEEEKCVNG